MTEQTSIASYYAAIDAGLISEKQQAVIGFMARRDLLSTTQGQVNRHFQDTNRSYAPRFKELEDSGVIRCIGTVFDDLTKRNVKAYRLTGEIPTEHVRRAKKTKVKIEVWEVNGTLGPQTFFDEDEAFVYAAARGREVTNRTQLAMKA